MIRKASMIGMALLSMSPLVNAAVFTSTNQADFDLVSEPFGNTPLGTNNNIVSLSGNITLDNAEGYGAPPTGTHGYTQWGQSTLDGYEYVMSGDENFNVIFSSLQTAFAFTYEDNSVASTFSLTFLNAGNTVGTGSFTTSEFDTEQFIGFISDAAFDEVKVREDDGGSNSDEYFQFYTATAKVPEPASVILMVLGLAGLGFHHKRKRNTKAFPNR